ncbi:MAG: YciI family protein [Streptococcaceae bacterium]|jgi:hypothetical protein|nr:YciI family protein [Streptococcaceae bacterium]
MKYLLIYKADPAGMTGMQMTPEAIEQMNQAWMAWGEKVGSHMVDFGSPTLAKSENADKGVGGYSILEAETYEALQLLLEGHPHTAMGGEIEVHEFMPMPGM